MWEVVHASPCYFKHCLFILSHIADTLHTFYHVQGHVTWWKLYKDMWHGGNCTRTCDMVEIVQGHVTRQKLYKDMWHCVNCTRTCDMAEIVQGHVTRCKYCGNLAAQIPAISRLPLPTSGLTQTCGFYGLGKTFIALILLSIVRTMTQCVSKISVQPQNECSSRTEGL